jgi:uncharacterized membrane protein
MRTPDKASGRHAGCYRFYVFNLCWRGVGMDKATPIRSVNLILAAGLGALLMYLLDPQQGRRRVSLARDRAVRVATASRRTTDAGLRDLAHRASGLVAQLRSALRPAVPSEEVLVERVRAQLGRWVSHPHAVKVTAAAGRVTVSGPVLESEQRQLLHGVQAVRGVREVENRLEPHRTAGRLPALQGGAAAQGRPRVEFLQENWAPGPRLLALTAGTALAWYGMARRGLGGAVLGAVGAGLAARAATNKDFGRLLGFAQGRRALDIEKTLHIAAPRETVFDIWSKFEDFPRFMSLVEDVRALDDTRSHWVVKGPAGRRFEWDSVITERVRPHLLRWCSEAGSPVQHAGIVRFDEDRGGTRVTVRLSYNPPGGALGHSLAALLGRDPKREMDVDLMRMKAFIETGVVPRDAAQRAAMPAVATSGLRPPEFERPGETATRSSMYRSY